MGPNKQQKRVLEHSPYGNVHRDIINAGYKRRRHLDWKAQAPQRQEALARLKSIMDHRRALRLMDKEVISTAVRKYLHRKDNRERAAKMKTAPFGSVKYSHRFDLTKNNGVKGSSPWRSYYVYSNARR